MTGSNSDSLVDSHQVLIASNLKSSYETCHWFSSTYSSREVVAGETDSLNSTESGVTCSICPSEVTTLVFM